MAPSKKFNAPGTVLRDSPNRIKATFVIDGYEYAFGGSVNPSLPPYTTKSATIYYDSVDDLTGTHDYKGSVGTSDYSLTFANGPVIEGALNVPHLDKKNQVDGSGIWGQS